MDSPAFRAIVSLTLQAVLLTGAYLLTTTGLALPPTLAGLRVYGPFAALAAAGAIALWFNRGRAALACACLWVAYLSYFGLLVTKADAATSRFVFVTLSCFVPANLALFSLLAERGVLNAYGLRRILVIATEVAIGYALLLNDGTGLADALAAPLIKAAWLKGVVVPQWALLIMALSLSATAGRALLDGSAIDSAVVGVVVAYGLACQHVGQPTTYGLYMSTAALALVIGVLQTSYRMAFHDELTGLPSRRSLNERLLGLGRHYTIAMLDVDHFKKFNDSYGHDVGDQVLKMVAAKLRQVGAGGRAFRYGGEEFALIFSGRSVRQVLPELESLREQVAQHRMALREPDRPVEAEVGRTLRTGSQGRRTVTVTVSIGVAERDDKLTTPDEVLKSADRALYRAKDKGRNQLSR